MGDITMAARPQKRAAKAGVRGITVPWKLRMGRPQVPGIPEGEVCACGEVIANCACEALEDDRRSLCQMSDSACSLNEGDHSAQETWLVQEYCSLGTLQVGLPLCLPLLPSPEPAAGASVPDTPTS